MIDKNKTCMQAMDSFIEGDPKRGKELLEVFLKEVKDSGSGPLSVSRSLQISR